MKKRGLPYFLLACLLQTGVCVGQINQETDETWQQYTENGVQFKFPSDQFRYKSYDKQFPALFNDLKMAFASGEPNHIMSAKSDGKKIRCGLIIIYGKINVMGDTLVNSIAKAVKTEMLSENIFTLVEEFIGEKNGHTNVYLAFNVNSVLVTISISFSDDSIVIASTEDASVNGKETEYFINQITFQ